MTDIPCRAAGLAYAERGWPVFVCKPHAKEPATRHGVSDATTDPAKIERWFKRNPHANIAIACGTPGPQVLDIDDLQAGHDTLVVVSGLHGPDVATYRGRQFYLQGSAAGTVALGYGELRGRGSYVIAPPSIHPMGKEYTWLNAPTDAPLPRIPDGIVPAGVGTAGTGVLEVQAELIPYGQRHEALKDVTVRLVRSGILDVTTLEFMLRDYFQARFVTTPKPRKDEFAKLAAWGVRTHIANRERAFSDHVEGEPAAAKKDKRNTGLHAPPRGDAPLKEHRDYLRIAGGWGDRIDIDRVRRFGSRPTDGLTFWLTNGQFVEFDRQEQITTRSYWARTIIMATGGIAHPVALNELEGLAVLRSLCILGDTPKVVHEAEAFSEHIDAMVAAAVTWDEFEVGTSEGRFRVAREFNTRGLWDSRKSDEQKPVVVVDRVDGRRYVRSGEVFAWLNAAGVRLAPAMLSGRMAMLGAERWECFGREPRRPDRNTRAQARVVLYRLADEDAGE